MKKNLLLQGLLLMSLFLIDSCSVVPLTGRQQLNLVPNSTMLATSFQQYDEFLNTNKVISNGQQADMVKRVGSKIQKAVEQYFSENNLSDALKDYNWEFNLVESEEVNAWCMPGGKVVVYSGILPIAEDEAGLAVIMGHEIAHAVARHGNERMSQQLATQMGGLALAVALKEKPEETQQLWMTAFGIGAQYGAILPYSRLHESEADLLGLVFMSLAGYNPKSAVDFWKRMSAIKGGESPPEFMSTHPSDDRRIRDIEKLLPEAMEYYNKTKVSGS